MFINAFAPPGCIPKLNTRLEPGDRIGTSLCKRMCALSVRDRTMGPSSYRGRMIRSLADGARPPKWLFGYFLVLLRYLHLAHAIPVTRVCLSCLAYSLDLCIRLILLIDEAQTIPDQVGPHQALLGRVRGGPSSVAPLPFVNLSDLPRSVRTAIDLSFQSAAPSRGGSTRNRTAATSRPHTSIPSQDFAPVLQVLVPLGAAVLDSWTRVFRHESAHADSRSIRYRPYIWRCVRVFQAWSNSGRCWIREKKERST